jgi:ParB-like chromosome segregation protein Spo0J
MTTIQVVTRDGVAVHCAYDELVELGELTPNPYNPNTHPPEQITLLAKIIIKTGWRCPVTVSRRSGLMVRGHGRLLAAQAAGMTVAPVDYQDYQSEEEERADLVADNRIPELAELDPMKLGDNLRFLEAQGADLEVAGFMSVDVAELLGPGPAMSTGDFMVPDGSPELPFDPVAPQGHDLARIVLLVTPDILQAVMRSIEYIGREYSAERFKIVS